MVVCNTCIFTSPIRGALWCNFWLKQVDPWKLEGCIYGIKRKENQNKGKQKEFSQRYFLKVKNDKITE